MGGAHCVSFWGGKRGSILLVGELGAVKLLAGDHGDAGEVLDEGGVERLGRLGLLSLDEGVLLGLLGGEASLGVDDEQLADEVHGFLGNGVELGRLEDEVTLHDELEELGVIVGVERQTTGQQNVQKDSASPHIDLRTVASSQEDIRGNVEGGTAGGLESLARVQLGQTKVGDLDFQVLLIVQKHVLELEIAVDDSNTVEVLQGREDLAHDVSSVLLAESLALNDHLVKLASLDQLHHDEQGSRCVEHSLQANDVGVVDLGHDVNLILQELGGLLDLALINDLNSNLLVGLLVNTYLDGGKETATERQERKTGQQSVI